MKENIAKRTTLTIGALTGAALISASSLLAGDYENKNASKSDMKESKAEKAMTARAIEGMDLNLKDGSSAGVIDDFVLSTDTGEVEGIAVGTGFLGLGGSEHYVSFDQLSISDIDRYNLSTSLSMEELEKHPRLDTESLKTSRDSETGVRSGQFAAMDLVGSDVKGANGATHGEVHDWIVDMQSGEVPYVIIRSAEPFATSSMYGFDYFAVSTDTISGTRDGDLIVSVTDEDFESAERIDENTALRDADESSVHTFRYSGGMAQASRG
ncbi:PRC-barrel domain-containing protein [Pelagicoccus sp. SDUM812002]|uniref:PRC-barrel domain-containing protein n=1 Tax=Pelagicoccus sp. SDUM812002 TaxID=3041266 RepID=UPI00280EFA94|nr:PRC-barrel domain-containing protein [Pelagicoccus sp. SDUM812002]MDQ8186482.1 PRC-barrel domain-containing protein [Pelagicoccus sp. SDUM812002]